MASNECKEDTNSGLTVEKLKDLMKNTLPENVHRFPVDRKKPAARVQPMGGLISPLFLHSAEPPDNPYDEVHQDLYLGDSNLAQDKEQLQQVGITHVVNAAQGPKFGQINTNAEYYADANISFIGINAIDTPRFQMNKHFHSVADFIEDALENTGKVYVHCQHGLSRSATLVLAFLMLKRSMSLEQAAVCVRQKRPVLPNDGFLQQLIHFEMELQCLKEMFIDSNKALDSVEPLKSPLGNGHCDTEICDNNKLVNSVTSELQSLATNGDHEQMSQACDNGSEVLDTEDSILTDKSGHKALTLEYVKEFMSFALPPEGSKKKGKKKKQSGIPLYVRKGNISSPAFVNDIDEVYPGIYLGNHKIARDLRGLRALDITHVLNTACGQGSMQVDTDQAYYTDAGIQFCGVPAKDIAAYKLNKHFDTTAQFIAKAVSKSGKVLVHCHQGRSRSAAVVLAYLMLKHEMTLLDAIKTLRERRWIWPNDGFLNQLIELNVQLYSSK